MSSEQLIVAWIGLLLTLVYLFTSKSFHQALVTTSSTPGTVQDVNFTAPSVPAAQQPTGTTLV